MLDNLNKELETIKINLSEIIEAYKNNVISKLYDGNMCSGYNEDEDRIGVGIEANNKNYIIKCDKIIYDYDFNNISINLNGSKNGNLIVINNQKYECNIYRHHKGNGHIILLGYGDGFVFREGDGHGHAIRLGSGEGDAWRFDEGNGHAFRLGSGDGNACRYDIGHGLAVRLGTGKGYASNKRNRK